MGWLTDYFRPQPRIPPQPDSEADWMIGDRAECVKEGVWWSSTYGEPMVGPAFRQVLRVVGVRPFCGSIILSFDEFDPGHWYFAGHFRKIRPARGASWLRKARCKRDPVPV